MSPHPGQLNSPLFSEAVQHVVIFKVKFDSEVILCGAVKAAMLSKHESTHLRPPSRVASWAVASIPSRSAYINVTNRLNLLPPPLLLLPTKSPFLNPSVYLIYPSLDLWILLFLQSSCWEDCSYTPFQRDKFWLSASLRLPQLWASSAHNHFLCVRNWITRCPTWEYLHSVRQQRSKFEINILKTSLL